MTSLLKGFDERIEQTERPPLLVGLAYDFQWLDAVPHGPGDRRVDAICSERQLCWLRPAP